MTQWTKIEPGPAGRRSKRTTPAVRRLDGGCYIVMPTVMVTGPRATFFTDNNGRLAVVMRETGDFAILADGSSRHLKRIIVPRKLWDKFPKGTTELSHTVEDGAVVLTMPEADKPAAPAGAAE